MLHLQLQSFRLGAFEERGEWEETKGRRIPQTHSPPLHGVKIVRHITRPIEDTVAVLTNAFKRPDLHAGGNLDIDGRVSSCR